MVFFLVSHMEESVKKKADAGLMINICLLKENHVLGVKVSSLRLIAIVSGGYMRCTCWEGVKEVSRRCQGGVKEVSSLGVLV